MSMKNVAKVRNEIPPKFGITIEIQNERIFNAISRYIKMIITRRFKISTIENEIGNIKILNVTILDRIKNKKGNLN